MLPGSRPRCGSSMSRPSRVRPRITCPPSRCGFTGQADARSLSCCRRRRGGDGSPASVEAWLESFCPTSRPSELWGRSPDCGSLAPGNRRSRPPASREAPADSRVGNRCSRLATAALFDRERDGPKRGLIRCEPSVAVGGHRPGQEIRDALFGASRCHNGTFPCFRRGSSSRFDASIARLRPSTRRVSAGSMTSST